MLFILELAIADNCGRWSTADGNDACMCDAFLLRPSGIPVAGGQVRSPNVKVVMGWWCPQVQHSIFYTNFVMLLLGFQCAIYNL